MAPNLHSSPTGQIAPVWSHTCPARNQEALGKWNQNPSSMAAVRNSLGEGVSWESQRWEEVRARSPGSKSQQ